MRSRSSAGRARKSKCLEGSFALIDLRLRGFFALAGSSADVAARFKFEEESMGVLGVLCAEGIAVEGSVVHEEVCSRSVRHTRGDYLRVGRS